MKKLIFICLVLVACKHSDKEATAEPPKTTTSSYTIPLELIIGKWQPIEVRVKRGRSAHTMRSTLQDSLPSFTFTEGYQLFYDTVHISDWTIEGHSINFSDNDSFRSPIHFSGMFQIAIHSKYRMLLEKAYKSAEESELIITYLLRRMKD